MSASRPARDLRSRRRTRRLAALGLVWFSACVTAVPPRFRIRAAIALGAIALLAVVLAMVAGGGEAPLLRAGASSPAGSAGATGAGAGGTGEQAPPIPSGAALSASSRDRAAAAPTTVSLTFDDGFADQYQNALPALRAHRFRATFYVNSGHLEDSSVFMTWAQVRVLAEAGNEIGGHTLDHPKLTLLRRADVEREVCKDRDNLGERGFRASDFAYPYGSYDVDIAEVVKGCGYESARAVGGLASRFDSACASCPSGESIPPLYPYSMRTADSVLSTTTSADLENLVAQATASGGGWITVVFHHVCENNCNPYSVSPAELGSFLDWLARRVADRQVAVETVQQVLTRR
jgi:peptidoglycan/xylan/chitin deacetylase (PgdA/CDA1 family)